MDGQRVNLETRDLGLLTLEEARADLLAGVMEEGGHNLGPAIEAYGKPFGLSPPINWCAVAIAAWVRRASALLDVEPLVGSPGAQATMGQFRAAGLWTPGDELRRGHKALIPGNIIIWWRYPNPNWMGHIGVIEEVAIGARDQIVTHTIEGNSGVSGDRVARMVRPLNDPKLLGIGRLRTTDDAPDTLTGAELQEAWRLMRLSHEVATFDGRDPMSIVQDMLDSIEQ